MNRLALAAAAKRNETRLLRSSGPVQSFLLLANVGLGWRPTEVGVGQQPPYPATFPTLHLASAASDATRHMGTVRKKVYILTPSTAVLVFAGELMPPSACGARMTNGDAGSHSLLQLQ